MTPETTDKINQDLIYLNYWKRKKLLKSGVPRFPLLRWWDSEYLCETEKVIFDKIKNIDRVIDVGAGDLRMLLKFKQTGYSGEYHTQDIGEEFSYTYRTLDEINKSYSAILCLDVIEHLPLAEGLKLIHRLVDLLEPGGLIVIQTPNARCIRSPLSGDMTHVHCYNLNDLWAYLTCIGLQVEGYRVVFEPESISFWSLPKILISRYIVTHFLGLDYADNILLIANRQCVK